MKTMMMKTVMTSLIALLLTTLFMTTAKAASVVYLPLVTSHTNAMASDPNATFRLENLRLWHVMENQGELAAPFSCGDTHKVEVHVFDVRGDRGDKSRLSHVKVQIVYWENGERVSESQTTGEPGVTHGVVEFELKQDADVTILTEEEHSVSSHTAHVTTLPNEIPAEQLIRGGYCQDDASCQAFVHDNRCAGVFSWNVVFKRSY